MNGFTQVIAFAGDASAVAVAVMLTVLTPKMPPINVGTGLFRSAASVRYTSTLTRVGLPAGSFGNVTSAVFTDTSLPMTWLASAVLMAL